MFYTLLFNNNVVKYTILILTINNKYLFINGWIIYYKIINSNVKINKKYFIKNERFWESEQIYKKWFSHWFFWINRNL